MIIVNDVSISNLTVPDELRAKEKSRLEERASLLETRLLIPGCMGRNGPNEHHSKSDLYCMREREREKCVEVVIYCKR